MEELWMDDEEKREAGGAVNRAARHQGGRARGMTGRCLAAQSALSPRQPAHAQPRLLRITTVSAYCWPAPQSACIDMCKNRTSGKALNARRVAATSTTVSFPHISPLQDTTTHCSQGLESAHQLCRRVYCDSQYADDSSCAIVSVTDITVNCAPE